VLQHQFIVATFADDELLRRVALSPDGSKMAFVAADTGGKSRIYVRPLNAGEARALEGTEGAWAPFWSPDGTRIGFFADGKLKTMSLAGGGATTVCDAPNSRGGSWGKNETIIFAPEFRGAIFRVSASGGTPTAITKVDTAKHTSHRWPIALPDGKHFLYLAINHDIPQDENDAIYYASMDGKESRQLIRSYSNVAYASGFLLFLQNGQLEAQRFDPESGALRGEMKSITTGITEDVSTWRAIFSVSENGLLAYSGSGGAESQLAWVDRSGKLLKTIGEKLEIIGSGVGFRLSPRGDRVAVSVRGAVTDIWVVDVARGVRTRLTFGPVENSAPVWSPDGKWIAFESQVKDGAVIKRKLADGGNEEDVIVSGPQLWRDAPFYTNDWSRDGKYLFLMKGGPGARQEIWAMPLFGDRKPFQVVPSGPYFSQYAYLSPNGRWLVYDSNESARAEVYVTAFPGGQGKRLVSTAGGTHARWSADGKELYYVSLDGTLTAVAVTEKGGQLELGTPQPLFHFAGFGYDVAPDGKKFLISVVNDANTKPITLLMNWTAETRSK
jgi:Tol biopolymer transport system component